MLRPNLNQLGVACCTLKRQLMQQQRLCWMHSAASSSRAYKCVAKSQHNIENGEAATQELLSSRDLQQHISSHGIQACLVPQPVSTSPSQVVKSMVLIIKDHQAQTASGSTAISSSSDIDADWTPASSAAANLATPSATPSPDSSRETSDSENTVSAVCPQSAVLVLLTGEVRVSEAAVAEHLGLPRRRLRLASREEAAAVTGYAVGAIPPFGHCTPLRTLIDVSISRQLAAQETLDSTPQQQPHLMCAGGGDGDTQLLLSVQQLCSAIPAAETGTFAEYTAGQPAEDVEAVQIRLQQQRQHWAAHLPLPWPAGGSKVHLIGVVAQRRRIAKLLLFASLIPEDVPPLPPDGKAAYVRRLWRHPDMPGSRCEVQIIMGKTIERALGRDATAALMDQVKVGSIISIKGHVQPHPAAATAARDTQPNGDSGSIGSSSSFRNVLDVVAHEVAVLHKSRDTLAKALRKAQRQGKQGVKTAAQLLHLQQQQWQRVDEGQLASQTHAHSSRRDAASARTPELCLSGGALTLERTASASRCDSSNVSSSSDFASATASDCAAASASRLADGTTTAAAAAPSSQDFWQLQLPLRAVHWVSDLTGISQMQQLVLQLPSGSNTTSSSSSSSSSSSCYSSSSRLSSSSTGSNPSDSSCDSSSSLADVVVGLDCEWRPYERGSTASSPVALLQLATREHVFLIDMLAICQQQQQQPGDQHSSSSSNGSRGALQPSTAAEAALGQFLLQLLCSPDVVKVGFQLNGDLERLQQSYPQLACFQPTAAAAAGIAAACPTSGAAPLVNYVDLLQLSRAAMPSLVKVPHLSLSKLVQLVLGKPLDKAQQTSHWDLRPLSLQQQVYAANDAHVLTRLFDELLRKAPEGSQGRVLRGIANGVRYLPVTKVEAADAEVLA